MTIWDEIYRNYQNEGECWATLSEEIHPLFKKFLQESEFKIGHVLDIGCGTGKYLEFLKSIGFKTDGIDSSETAIQMNKQKLGDDSSIICVNMFEFEIPKNKYDLVISISTIHHGTKQEVENLINKIYDAIAENGKIFITLPDFEINNRNNKFENQKKIGKGTFAPLSGPEKSLVHSFYTKNEAQKLFKKFKDVKIELDEIGRWIITGSK